MKYIKELIDRLDSLINESKELVELGIDQVVLIDYISIEEELKLAKKELEQYEIYSI